MLQRRALGMVIFASLVAVGCTKTADQSNPKVAERAPSAAASTSSTPPAPVAVEAPTPTPLAGDSPMWTAPIKTLKGEPTTLAAFKGKALMLVNVASKCGNTPQYTQLEALQDKYGPQGFTVVGFPCNQFGGQEPGSAEEIAEFCSATYGVTFPMMEKIEVNGDQRHAIYKQLTAIPGQDGKPGDIQWNFEKFVVSADGTKITRFAPKTKPDDPKVIAAVEAALPRS